jgi:hypothetical protein
MDNIDGLKPNADAMYDGLSFWFKECFRGKLEIGWRDPATKKLNRFKRFELDEIEELVAFAADINAQPGANMYFRVCTLKDLPGPTTDEHFWLAPGAHVDHDDAESVAKLKSHPLPIKPAFLIITGREPAIRAQSFWPISEATSLEESIRLFNKNLAHHFGGDPAVVNPTRLMRMPGSIAWPVKPGRTKPELTQLLWPSDNRQSRYPLHAMQHYTKDIGEPAQQPQLQPQEAAPEAPVTAVVATPFDIDTGASGAPISVLIRQIGQPHLWHQSVLRLVASWVNRGFSDAEILMMAPAITMSGYTLKQTREELATMIKGAREKWGLPNVDPSSGEVKKARPKDLPLIYFEDVRVNLDAADFVEGVLIEGAMSVVYGESNCGKTFFMTDLALHIAAGKPWNGRAVDQGGVIYCALEGSHGISNRVAAFRQHHGLEDAILPFAIVPVSINLLDPEADSQKLIEAVQAAAQKMGMPVKLVVLDTLSRALSGGNENAPDDMGALVNSIDKIRQATGAHVCGVHHSGKDAARGARGHSLLRAATDTEIEISRSDPQSPSTAVVKKQRELEIEGTWTFSLEVVELGTNRRGKAVTSCVVTAVAAPPPPIKKGPKLNDWEVIAMTAIKDCIGERGEMGFGNLPRVKVVSVEQWRAKWFSRASIDDPVTKRVTWARTKQRLINVKLVGFMDEKVWLIQDDEGREGV